jgi:hypothetical protein
MVSGFSKTKQRIFFYFNFFFTWTTHFGQLTEKFCLYLGSNHQFGGVSEARRIRVCISRCNLKKDSFKMCTIYLIIFQLPIIAQYYTIFFLYITRYKSFTWYYTNISIQPVRFKWSHITWMLFALHTPYSKICKDDLMTVS